jgi:pimeloyl-ACP methyl ester carboxylesterase
LFNEFLHGAYVPERWAADTDTALRALGDDAWLIGAGVSAYIALLLAGARPESVRGALLLPGHGLDGGGAEPDIEHAPPPPLAARELTAFRRQASYDPAVFFSESVIRPVERARACGEAAGALVLSEDGCSRPPWWRALDGLANARVHRSASTASALCTLVAPQGSISLAQQSA